MDYFVVALQVTWKTSKEAEVKVVVAKLKVAEASKYEEATKAALAKAKGENRSLKAEVRLVEAKLKDVKA